MKDREREKKEGGGWLVGIYQDIFIHAFTKEWIKPIGMIKSPKKEKREPKSRSQIRGPTRWLSLFFFFFFKKIFMFFFAAAQTTPGPSAPLFSLLKKKKPVTPPSLLFFSCIYLYIYTHTYSPSALPSCNFSLPAHHLPTF
jgi:hypothetical protein